MYWYALSQCVWTWIALIICMTYISSPFKFGACNTTDKTRWSHVTFTFILHERNMINYNYIWLSFICIYVCVINWNGCLELHFHIQILKVSEILNTKTYWNFYQWSNFCFVGVIVQLQNAYKIIAMHAKKVICSYFE